MLIIGSMVSGLGQALLWIAQGEYIGLCATKSTQGFYFGYFWGMFSINQVIGNWAGGKLLSEVPGTRTRVFRALDDVGAEELRGPRRVASDDWGTRVRRPLFGCRHGFRVVEADLRYGSSLLLRQARVVEGV